MAMNQLYSLHSPNIASIQGYRARNLLARTNSQNMYLIITKILQETTTLLLYTRLKAVFRRYKDVVKDRNTRDYLAWIIANRDPMHDVCITHSITRAWEQEG